MKRYKVKSLNYSKSAKESDQYNIYLDNYSSVEKLDEAVLMTADNYKEIFGYKKSIVSQEKLSLIHISEPTRP